MCGVQVNFLKCGGVALGTALHHVGIDAVSAVHFLQTWSAFSKDGEAAARLELPCHDRTLLRASFPPVVHPDALTVILPKLGPSSEMSVAVVNKIFVLSKDQVDALKRACTGGGSTVSTFCAVGAHVWRCLCAARRLPLDATTRVTFPANIRRSLRPPLPASYFGNATIVLGAAGKVRDIIASESEDDQPPLASVAGRIRSAVRRLDDEVARSAIDYSEMAGSLPALYAKSMPVTDLSVVSWLGMPAGDADFGWGKPLVLHRAEQLRAGVVYLMDGAGGSVRMLMSMEPEILNDLERLLYANF